MICLLPHFAVWVSLGGGVVHEAGTSSGEGNAWGSGTPWPCVTCPTSDVVVGALQTSRPRKDSVPEYCRRRRGRDAQGQKQRDCPTLTYAPPLPVSNECPVPRTPPFGP